MMIPVIENIWNTWRIIKWGCRGAVMGEGAFEMSEKKRGPGGTL